MLLHAASVLKGWQYFFKKFTLKLNFFLSGVIFQKLMIFAGIEEGIEEDK